MDMASSLPRSLEKIAYYEAAQAYLRSLPQEHFMESVSQANQRKISVFCLGVVAEDRPDVQVFNELLVQFRRPGGKIGQVVPDNMVIVCSEAIRAETSYDVPHQPVGPYLVLEYVSRNNKRKDYEDSFDKYERELKVPYYLIFYPDDQELTLYRLSRGRYVSVKPNKHGRLEIPKLELEVAILDGWVRFWYKGQLIPLPADLLRELAETREELKATREQLDEAKRRAAQAEEENARLRAELERLRKP
jgi:Uma2 family endonuclease